MKQIKIKYSPKGPLVFKRMIEDMPSGIKKGDIVEIIKDNEFYGYGFYNQKSNIILRLITKQKYEKFDIESYLYEKIKNAIDFRKSLNIPSQDTNTYRLINDYGDELNGIIIDIYDIYAVVEVYSYGYYLLKEKIINILKKLLNIQDIYFHATDFIMTMEDFKINESYTQRKIKIKENGIIFEIELLNGYKTGFFIDQRENRMYLTNFVKDKSVLDLFSYTGGFGIYAKKHGADEVTCVDLDEYAINQLKRNANINNLKINAVRSDVFTYMRQMIENKKVYDIVILDPNKLITSTQAKEKGIIEYIDLNKLALKLIKENGIFVSCSCSGMLSMDEFISIIRKASSISKRNIRVFKKSGAGVDHPFVVNYPENEYLKVVWCFVE